MANIGLYLLHRDCSPRDRGIGLETAWDRNFAVLVLALVVLVLVSISAVFKTDR